MAVAWKQTTFRFRNDDGSESTATWRQNANVNDAITVNSGNATFRIRIAAQETGTTAGALTGRLYIQKNGTGGYVQASASATTGCRVIASANLTDDGATTSQLGLTPFVAGKVDDVDGQCGATASIARYSYSEHEYMLQLEWAHLADGDYFDFREYNSTSAFGTYTVTGRMTVALAPVLVIADSSHGHTADGSGLTQHNVLAINSALHLQSADSATLTAHEASTSLAIQDAAHSHSAGAAVLVQHNVLAIQAAAHAQAADSLALTQHGALAIADASHAQTAATVGLVQHNALVIQGASHAQSADNAGLTAHSPAGVTLTVQDASHVQTADAATLLAHDPVTAVQLTIQDAAHSQSAEAVALFQHHILAVADAAHTHNAERVTLTAHGQEAAVLVVHDATHAQIAEAVDLVQHSILAIQDAVHEQTAGNVVLVLGISGPGDSRIVRVAERQIVKTNGRTTLRVVERPLVAIE
jgi:hypothetical protein